MVLEGELFDHYRILRLIGKGGMGEVYLAEDTQVQRQVAAKVVRLEEELLSQETIAGDLHFFWREASIIAKLDHPAILPLYDHGDMSLDTLYFTYLITPYCPDGSLLRWMRHRGLNRPVTHQQIGWIIGQAGQALQYAHDQRVMHLDIKPANFLIRKRPGSDELLALLLSDFGIARLAMTTASFSQDIRGTPTYMAPEQWANHPTFASDQYALAIMAYELLAGSPPFQGPPMNIMFGHLQEQPPSIGERNPRVPAAVNLVVQRALAKKPEERFPSIAEFAHTLQEALESKLDERAGGAETLAALPAKASEVALLPRDSQTDQQLVAGSGLSPAQEIDEQSLEATLPRLSRAAPDSVTLSSVPDTQAAHFLPSLVPLLSSTHPGQIFRRRPVLATAAIALLIVILLVGGSVGITMVGQQARVDTSRNTALTAQAQITNTARARITATAQAQAAATGAVLRTGKIWHTQLSGASSNLLNLTWGDSQLVAVGDGGTIVTSPDGHAWTVEPLVGGAALWSVAWGDSRFVVVGAGGQAGESGVILTSLDGHTWTRLSPGTGPLLSVTWGGSQFVAVGASDPSGNNNTILTSPDGRTWMAQQPPPHATSFLQAVAWADFLFVVVGGNGLIATSPDGHTWTLQQSPTSNNLAAVISSGNSRLVAVGDNGTLLTSS